MCQTSSSSRWISHLDGQTSCQGAARLKTPWWSRFVWVTYRSQTFPSRLWTLCSPRTDKAGLREVREGPTCLLGFLTLTAWLTPWQRERGGGEEGWLCALEPGQGMTLTSLQTSSSSLPLQWLLPFVTLIHTHTPLLISELHLRSWLHAATHRRGVMHNLLCCEPSCLPHPSAVKDICGELLSSSDKTTVMSEAQSPRGRWLMHINRGHPHPATTPAYPHTHAAPMACFIWPPHILPWTPPATQ